VREGEKSRFHNLPLAQKKEEKKKELQIFAFAKLFRARRIQAFRFQLELIRIRKEKSG